MLGPLLVTVAAAKSAHGTALRVDGRRDSGWPVTGSLHVASDGISPTMCDSDRCGSGARARSDETLPDP